MIMISGFTLRVDLHRSEVMWNGGISACTSGDENIFETVAQELQFRQGFLAFPEGERRRPHDAAAESGCAAYPFHIASLVASLSLLGRNNGGAHGFHELRSCVLLNFVQGWAFDCVSRPREHLKAVLTGRWTACRGGQIRCPGSPFVVLLEGRGSHVKIHRQERRRKWASVGRKKFACGCRLSALDEVCSRIWGGMHLGLQVVRQGWW